MLKSNLYYAAAQAQWHAGVDGELIVRALAEAFCAIAISEVGNENLVKEFERLMPKAPIIKP